MLTICFYRTLIFIKQWLFSHQHGDFKEYSQTSCKWTISEDIQWFFSKQTQFSIRILDKLLEQAFIILNFSIHQIPCIRINQIFYNCKNRPEFVRQNIIY